MAATPEEMPYLRVIFDLTGYMDITSRGLVKRDGRNSHLLVVRMFAEKTQWVALDHPHVDIVLDIEETDVERGANACRKDSVDRIKTCLRVPQK